MLVAIAVISIGGAQRSASWPHFAWTPWLLPFVAIGTFIVVTYNLELFGRFHSDAWFVLAWGAFPVLTAYVGAAGRSALSPLAAGFAACMSFAQRALDAVGGEATRTSVEGERHTWVRAREDHRRDARSPARGAFAR